jgi:hypothetical protein
MSCSKVNVTFMFSVVILNFNITARYALGVRELRQSWSRVVAELVNLCKIFAVSQSLNKPASNLCIKLNRITL